MNYPILAPAHYTVYPVQPIEITRYFGFCLGNATKYVLRAPYKGGVEDCQKALRYLELERQMPQNALPAYKYFLVKASSLQLEKFLCCSEGDPLWDDISVTQQNFLEHLRTYVLDPPRNNLIDEMKEEVRYLERILSLRDTTGQIYEGMNGLPVRGDANE